MSNDARSRPMTAETIHTCSYECERPECIRAQRDELAAWLTCIRAQRDELAARLTALAAEGVQAEPKAEAQLTYKGVPVGPMQTFADIERQAIAPAAARVDVTWPLSILEAGNWREVYMGTKHMRLEVSYPYEAWERLMAALAAAQQQPAEGEEIMVNTPYDVFILPLRPSGLDGKGPRFVVHVPGPEQPAPQAQSSTEAWRDLAIAGAAIVEEIREIVGLKGKPGDVVEAVRELAAPKPDTVAGLVGKAYAGCTIWRGSLRVSVTETEAIEHRIDADEAFCDLAQRALDSLAAAWDAAALAAQPGGSDNGR